MSWRDTLGQPRAPKSPCTHNSHNTQKPAGPRNCADIASSAYGSEEEGGSRLLEALARACQGLSIKPPEIRDALAPEDIEGWRCGEMSDETLTVFAQALVQRREMRQGIRPDSYSERATCAHCGPIWLWVECDVLGCPWCWNRARGLPIPRPDRVRCVDCRHWTQDIIGDGNGIGTCAAGGPPAGQVPAYPRAARTCERWLPKSEVLGEMRDGE
jgi:hypothetical protein